MIKRICVLLINLLLPGTGFIFFRQIKVKISYKDLIDPKRYLLKKVIKKRYQDTHDKFTGTVIQNRTDIDTISNLKC